MPITPALLAKLSQRGFAPSSIQPPEKEIQATTAAPTVPFCPNKFNIHHDCTAWCAAHWKGFASPEPRYAQNLKIALAKYPLPPNWVEAFDAGIGRCYFWNTDTEMVCWLPPTHPKAVISESAEIMRRRMKKNASSVGGENEGPRNRDQRRSHHSHSHSHHHKYDDHKPRYSKNPRRDDSKFDPMDPASYSDVPRGTWKDGMDTRGSADRTASGVAFQQRPYPSPGEVLAGNRTKK